MSLDKETVEKVARLARIELDAAQIAPFATELSKIIDWVEQLDAVNTDAVEPLRSVSEMEAFVRADEVLDGGYVERVLSNAPKRHETFFVVPKVVE